MPSIFKSRRCAAIAAATTVFAVVPTALQAQNTGQLVVGQLQFVPNTHPLIQVNNTKLFLMGFIQRPITAFDPSGQSVCILCTVKPTLESGMAKIVDLPGGKKGMQVTLKLRPDVKWGDGTPVSSKDIAFTWKMANDSNVGFSNYNAWTRATKVDVVDAKTVVMHLPKVAVGYDSWDHVLPAHLEGPIYEKFKTPDEYAKQSLYNRDSTNPGLWNGAYVVSSMQLGAQVTLVANKHWPDQVHIPKVVLSYRSSATALVQNLLSGDLDAVPVSPGGISFTQMLTLRKENASRFSFPVGPGYNLERVAFQLKNPLLADVRVRKAIAFAIDREAISARLFEKLQPVANSIVVPTSVNHSTDVPKYTHDLARARALMAEAGWKPGPDGICVNSTGQKMAFDLVTTAGNQTRLQIAQVMQNQLKAICINLSVKQAPIAVFNGEEMRKRQFNGMSLSSIQFPPSTSPALFLGTDSIPTDQNEWTGNNFSGYSSVAMDAAVIEAEAALQPAAAKAAWAKIQRIAADELPILPMYFYATAWVAPNDFSGMDVSRFDQPTNWAEEWRRK
ncbi:peptide ABC transporter substrate-binding protein [Hydrogenophaga sp. PBL-H3]|uniref:peptide ABC transporter substrate-binding protein n=1 Tax=Hydrogenophaga sp. PBL-H3 TaxID=434010 RepID=UPI00131FCDA3|nr:peptide ABC transporter substrate-binding protein [Hydrogenophaga sp. PBL-H3]QHE74885.1 peptide ABC transporter substrate-binding protein [Hydrogenophaga sp. PBL-H3]QHE79312.1 peptide ABC transporter substrate-binding protein [Hydrogenophaga sp. PBL-H3]